MTSSCAGECQHAVEHTCIYEKKSDLEEEVGVVEDEELSRRDVSIDDDDCGLCKMGNMPGRWPRTEFSIPR